MKSTLENIWKRRHLLHVLTTSNIKRQNKNTALGYLWWLLDPILMTAVYFLLVAVLFRRGGDNQPYILFVLCGLLAWKAFATSVDQSIASIRGQAGIVRAISFPKIVLPFSFVFSNTLFFLLSLVVAVALSLWYGPEHGTWPGFSYLMLPVVIVLQMLFTAGVALFVAALGVLFIDTSNIMGHLLRIWYFLSPGLYSMDRIPERFLPIYRLNPFCDLMTAYRDIIMRGQMPDAFGLGYVFFIGVIGFAIGYWFFRRLEGHLVHRL